MWFTVEGIQGGTDAYCKHLESKDIDPEDPWWKVDYIKDQNTQIEDIDPKLEKSKILNRSWYFRRSAGQPATIALSYGMISAAVAELTGGILRFDDGAWDHKRWPAHSKDFLDWYFRPDKALTTDNKEWAQICIEGIKDEINTPDNVFANKNRNWLQKFLGK